MCITILQARILLIEEQNQAFEESLRNDAQRV